MESVWGWARYFRESRYFRDLQEATIILTLLSRGWQFSGGGSLLLEVHGICFVLKFK